MPSTFQGIGTCFYGHRDDAPDGTFLTTEWVVVLYVPLLPIASYRVRQTVGGTSRWMWIGIGFYSSTSHRFEIQRVPLNWLQVRNVYGGLLGISAAVVGLLYCIGFVMDAVVNWAVPQ